MIGHFARARAVQLALTHAQQCTLDRRLFRTWLYSISAKSSFNTMQRVPSVRPCALGGQDKAHVKVLHHPTLQLIKQRHAEGSRPGQRSDCFKLGLVVEGGGMRGVISGAMLMGLRALGLRDVFDAVYGSSAGAINATYFISGQPHGLDIYTEDLVDGRFLDLSALLLPSALRRWQAPADNMLSNRPAMDLSYLLDHVMQRVRPLDLASVLASPLPLKIVASSLDELRPITFDSFTNEADLMDCLAASATIPEVVGPPRVVRGHRCVDAAVFEPVPVGSALRDGCTHVLVLCTRTAAKVTGTKAPVYHAATQALEMAVKKTFLNVHYMQEAWRNPGSSAGREHDDALYDALHGCPQASHSQLGGYVLPLYPDSIRGVHPVCTDVQKLSAARIEGYRAIDRLVGAPMGLVFEPGSCAATWNALGAPEAGSSSAAAAASSSYGGSGAA